MEIKHTLRMPYVGASFAIVLALVGLFWLAAPGHTAPDAEQPIAAVSNISANTPDATVKAFLIALQRKDYDAVKSMVVAESMIGNEYPDALSGLKSNYGLSYVVSLLPPLQNDSFTASVMLEYSGKGELTLSYSQELQDIHFWSPIGNKHRNYVFKEGAFVTIQPSSSLKAAWGQKLPEALQKVLVFPLLKNADGKWYVDVECLNVTIMGLGQDDIGDSKLRLGIANTNFIPRYPQRYYNMYIEQTKELLKNKK